MKISKFGKLYLKFHAVVDGKIMTNPSFLLQIEAIYQEVCDFDVLNDESKPRRISATSFKALTLAVNKPIFRSM